MSALDILKEVHFDPVKYDPHQWFIEQDAFNMCAYDDEPIDIPVLIISEYTMAHYKYYISICCEKNLDDFYECLGTQPLKMVFSHLINEDYVKRHGFNVFPDTDLSRDFHIHKNELYLDSNEIELDPEENQEVLPDEIDELTDEDSSDDENSDLEEYELDEDENLNLQKMEEVKLK